MRSFIYGKWLSQAHFLNFLVGISMLLSASLSFSYPEKRYVNIKYVGKVHYFQILFVKNAQGRVEWFPLDMLGSPLDLQSIGNDAEQVNRNDQFVEFKRFGDKSDIELVFFEYFFDQVYSHRYREFCKFTGDLNPVEKDNRCYLRYLKNAFTELAEELTKVGEERRLSGHATPISTHQQYSFNSPEIDNLYDLGRLLRLLNRCAESDCNSLNSVVLDYYLGPRKRLTDDNLKLAATIRTDFFGKVEASNAWKVKLESIYSNTYAFYYGDEYENFYFYSIPEFHYSNRNQTSINAEIQATIASERESTDEDDKLDTATGGAPEPRRDRNCNIQ